jgi:ABC-type branched-subunit amino acid transport system substrate-binding protein
VGFSTRGALRDVGIASDGDFLKSQRATQSEFSDVVQAMKNKGSNYGQCTGAFTCTVNLRKEAALQGLTGVKVWDCGVSCYDSQFLAAGGSDVDGEYVDMSVLPFFSKAEQKANPMLANYVKYTGSSKVASYGAFAWAAGLAFRQAVDAAVKQHGVNGVTRQNLFTALNQIHDFDAGGLIGSVDLAGRKTTECHVTVQVRNGTFVRVNPKKPGTFDCSPRYVIHRQLDLLGS